MNEIDFKNWLCSSGYSKKVAGDTISRIKKIERVNFCIDIDQEYSKDKCMTLLSVFKNKGKNEEMKKLDSSSLPIGKYQLSTYKYAVNLYVKFLEQSN